MNILVLSECCVSDEMESKLGTFIMHDESWTMVNDPETDVCVKRTDGSVIAIVRRKAISNDLTDLAVRSYLKVGKMVSSNRGHAAGLQRRTKTHTTFEKGENANTGIIGYMDNTNISRPCRMTQFTQRHFDVYSRGLPFIQRIDECFRENLPTVHNLQYLMAQRTKYHILGTAFSTVTVNYNFRTGLHKDSGDYRQGFGNLVVCQQHMKGGELLFPRYKLALTLNTGDFMAMDVHEFHCNSPLCPEAEDAFRLSFVCYLRDRMQYCNDINKQIQKMQSATKHTDDIIRDIFAMYNELTLPTKEITGCGKQGNAWWIMKGMRIALTYKNKRYTLFDTLQNKKVHELINIWNYASTLANQSLMEPDLNQAQ